MQAHAIDSFAALGTGRVCSVTECIQLSASPFVLKRYRACRYMHASALQRSEEVTLFVAVSQHEIARARLFAFNQQCKIHMLHASFPLLCINVHSGHMYTYTGSVADEK